MLQLNAYGSFLEKDDSMKWHVHTLRVLRMCVGDDMMVTWSLFRSKNDVWSNHAKLSMISENLALFIKYVQGQGCMNVSKRINKLLTPNQSEISKVRIYKACLFRLKLSRILFSPLLFFWHYYATQYPTFPKCHLLCKRRSWICYCWYDHRQGLLVFRVGVCCCYFTTKDPRVGKVKRGACL